jgi:hypothetical protein
MNLNNAYGNSILDESIYNGRIDILSNENPKTRIDMMEKIASKNKAVSYCDAMKGQWEDNVLSQAFFCKENIQIIQNGIRSGVYEKSGNKFVVSPPNMDNLQIIMRSYFLSYVEFYEKDITKQIAYLNKIVIDYCVKELFSASQSYVNYLQDQSSMYMPLKQPLNHDRNYKQLQLKDWV